MPGSAAHKISSAFTKAVKLLFLFWLFFVKKQMVPNGVHSLRMAKRKSCIQMGHPPGGGSYISPCTSTDCPSPRRAPFNCLYRDCSKARVHNPLGGLISLHPVKKPKLMRGKDPKLVTRIFYIHNFHHPEKAVGRICPLGRKSKWKNASCMNRSGKMHLIGENDEEMFNQISSSVMRSNPMWGGNYERNGLLEIVNNQTEVPIDLAHFEKEVRKLIHLMRFEDFQLNITFVSLKEMKEVNRTHRGKNEPTDVISLLHCVHSGEGVSPGGDFASGGGLRSGDIYLCPAYISRECVLARVRYERGLLADQSDGSDGEVGESTLANRDTQQSDQGELRPRGVNKLFGTLFCAHQRLPLYVLHGLIHLTNKDHVKNANEYNAFMDVEEDLIGKYLKFHHYTHTFYSHYVIGLGTDILNVNRIYKILQKGSGAFFLRKVLSSLELRELAQGGEAAGSDQLGGADGKADRQADRHADCQADRHADCQADRHADYQADCHADRQADCPEDCREDPTQSLVQKLTANCTLKLAIHVSKKFAAKEAILKSMGRGLSSISKYGLSMNDIEVRNDKYGKPLVFLYDQARQIANEMGIVNIFLSLSDERITCTSHNLTKDESTVCKSCTYLIHAQALSVGSNV
ncbi:holo-[acyl-carrier-protein] synthase, putative [Plasmodium vivax]|nr:holo-[acyl-carrier-protein] synthase, putative [Plasmodium vivax]